MAASATCLPLPAGNGTLSDDPQPVVAPGRPGFTRRDNLIVAHELEADRLALLLMGRQAQTQHERSWLALSA